MTAPTPIEFRIELARLFQLADAAGYGIARGDAFEAFPGLEHAAADYIESLLEGDNK